MNNVHDNNLQEYSINLAVSAPGTPPLTVNICKKSPRYRGWNLTVFLTSSMNSSARSGRDIELVLSRRAFLKASVIIPFSSQATATVLKVV
jgi:hypothetical protein